MAATVGRDLIPAGSWANPYRRAMLMMSMSRPYLIWFAIWFGGSMAITLYSVCSAGFKCGSYLFTRRIARKRWRMSWTKEFECLE